MDFDPRALFPPVGFLILAQYMWAWYRWREIRKLIQREGTETRLAIASSDKRRREEARREREDRERARLWPEGSETDRDQLHAGSGGPPEDGTRGSR